MGHMAGGACIVGVHCIAEETTSWGKGHGVNLEGQKQNGGGKLGGGTFDEGANTIRDK
jgi:hypothetical protein